MTDGSIDLLRPITLICGENGAGKSTLLHTIFHAVATADVAADMGGYSRPLVGRIESIRFEIRRGDAQTEERSTVEQVRAYFSPEGDTARVALIDAGMHVPAILDFIKSEGNFAEHLEGVDPSRFSAEELAEVGFIIGRSYDAVFASEIVASSFGDVLPYFHVESQGVVYGALDMGYGELAVLYIVWILSRLPQGSLLLVEEPEAFLSPRSQTALVDVLAKYVKRTDLTVVMTSHSGPIAQRLDNAEIIYATRSAGRVVLHTPARSSDLISRLGLIPERPFIAFVEDRAGEILAKTLLDLTSERLAGIVEFVICDGESNVVRALGAIPVTVSSVSHVGVLDGDQRNVEQSDRRIVFLPGDGAPETLLISHARAIGERALSIALGVEPDDLSRGIAHADGQDLHDWPYTVAGALGLHHAELLRRLAVSWATANSADTELFVQGIEQFGASKN